MDVHIRKPVDAEADLAGPVLARMRQLFANVCISRQHTDRPLWLAETENLSGTAAVADEACSPTSWSGAGDPRHPLQQDSASCLSRLSCIAATNASGKTSLALARASDFAIASFCDQTG